MTQIDPRLVMRLIEAADNLASIAQDSVEYSSWPELQDAVRRVGGLTVAVSSELPLEIHVHGDEK